jgi:hypothetical protein
VQEKSTGKFLTEQKFFLTDPCLLKGQKILQAKWNEEIEVPWEGCNSQDTLLLFEIYDPTTTSQTNKIAWAFCSLAAIFREKSVRLQLFCYPKKDLASLTKDEMAKWSIPPVFNLWKNPKKRTPYPSTLFLSTSEDDTMSMPAVTPRATDAIDTGRTWNPLNNIGTEKETVLPVVRKLDTNSKR